MRHKEIWSDKYKGINYEIAHWGIDSYMPNGIWNAYIVILKPQLPDKFQDLICKYSKSTLLSKRKFWDYNNLDDIFDMHGGLTYYEPKRDEFSGKVNAIKVGCDYAHSFDEGMIYDQDDVQRDTIKSIECFIEKYPDYLVWNPVDGSFISPELLKETK